MFLLGALSQIHQGCGEAEPSSLLEPGVETGDAGTDPQPTHVPEWVRLGVGFERSTLWSTVTNSSWFEARRTTAGTTATTFG